MSVRSRKLAKVLVLAAVALPLACGDAMGPPEQNFENPSTVRVVNNLLGPILFFHVRACGTTDWGDDLLPLDPVNGKINPGSSKDFTVEAGCYDFQARHLPDSSGAGQLVFKEIFDQVTSPVAIVTWELAETPGNPS